MTALEWFNTYGPAWVQAVGSVGALLLAIYVPIRMRRTEEFDRLESTIGIAIELAKVGEEYADALETGGYLHPEPPTSLPVHLAAIQNFVAGGSLPAELLAYLNEVAIAAQNLEAHWRGAGAGSARRDNPNLQQAARMRALRLTLSAAQAERFVESWRRRHRLVLAFY